MKKIVKNGLIAIFVVLLTLCLVSCGGNDPKNPASGSGAGGGGEPAGGSPADDLTWTPFASSESIYDNLSHPSEESICVTRGGSVPGGTMGVKIDYDEATGFKLELYFATSLAMSESPSAKAYFDGCSTKYTNQIFAENKKKISFVTENLTKEQILAQLPDGSSDTFVMRMEGIMRYTDSEYNYYVTYKGLNLREIRSWIEAK